MSNFLVKLIVTIMVTIMLLLTVGLGYIVFAMSIWAGIVYIIFLITITVYFLFEQTNTE